MFVDAHRKTGTLLVSMAQTPESTNANDMEEVWRNSQEFPASKGQGLQKPVGYFMSHISGGAGWWKSPSPDLVRGALGKPGRLLDTPAGATQLGL